MQKKGFTLLEVLIVVIILASVVLFAVPSYKKGQARAQYSAALGTLMQLGNALKSIRADYKSAMDNPDAEFWDVDNPVEFSATDYNGVTSAYLDAVSSVELQYEGTDSSAVHKKLYLEAMGYMMRPRFDTAYQYFICNPSREENSGCCRPDALACMALPTVDNNNREYRTAVFYEDGHFEREAAASN